MDRDGYEGWRLLILFLLIGVGAWFALNYIGRYEQKAAEFDLAKLDAVESASVIYDRYGQVFGNAEYPNGTSKWSGRFQMQFLFPKKR